MAENPSVSLPIIAIGTSAGGLEAASRLLDAIALAKAAAPAGALAESAAIILVQHLDPHHPSLLTELLGQHTAMTVAEARDGCSLAAGHVYIIPPGRYLAVRSGKLHLSVAPGHNGVRLPFDFLLTSLAEANGARAICVILSGTGADGSASLAAFKQAGGYVIAQDPEEAEYAGMPQSAIDIGLVDRILRLADMPAALGHRTKLMAQGAPADPLPAPINTPLAGESPEDLADILALLKDSTGQDFSQYKPGTIGRRVSRRMGLLAIPLGDLTGYLARLHKEPEERAALAHDLLINVTSFFRDPKVFEALGGAIIPPLLAKLAPGEALRVWVAGCSTGEEAYSIAMVCHDAIAAAGRTIKLQIFASDVDSDAIAVAREGHYPLDIAGAVSPARLAQYFTRDDTGYRIAPTLRGDVVFTVQDLLSDPPFSRIDFISCRNLLIYLNLEAQAKAISLFHFALREGGVLLLGGSETVGKNADRFAIIAETERFYRHVGRSRAGEPGFPFSFGGVLPRLTTTNRDALPPRHANLADICSRAVLADYAPTALLIDAKRHVVYSLGKTQRYLRLAPGYANLDILAMAPTALRTKLKLAIDKARHSGEKVRTRRARTSFEGAEIAFSIEVDPLGAADPELMLLCFIEEPPHHAANCRADAAPLSAGAGTSELARITELEAELAAAQAELQTAILGQETATQEQKAINEEALSVNEEFQSTNEELLTSKEELQSLNEELTALNSQLQETLDRQRLTSDDLQNVLYSTNVATLFLDAALKIRFFTPAIKALFSVIPGDIGRPIADLRSIAIDGALIDDAQRVLSEKALIERELAAPGDIWFLRRVFPYLTHNGDVEGVVITFADITQHKMVDAALEAAKLAAERATIAKSRFLAAASHDLRQPLQSLTLMQELLAQTVEGDKPKKLVERVGVTLRAMSGMLNALLDINQIEAGTLQPQRSVFALSEIFQRLADEYDYIAKARGLRLRVMPTSAMVVSDPQLLEQMLRNILGNAKKYTDHGTVLVGCRRRGPNICIEVWDTGIGIPQDQLGAIFEEFHQVDNTARQLSRGLGLGLSIVQRLGILLGHAVDVASVPGKGSVFRIIVPLSPTAEVVPQPPAATSIAAEMARRDGRMVLVVDDDPDVLDLLEQLLRARGYRVRGAVEAAAALQLVAASVIMPDIVLTDYNLPGGLNGLELVGRLRDRLGQELAAIILTGDITTETMAKIAGENCARLSKPVDPQALILEIEQLCLRGVPMPAPPADTALALTTPSAPSSQSSAPVIHIVDDDAEIRTSLRQLLELQGHAVADFASAETFLAAYRAGAEACLLVDAHLPGMDGVDLLAALRARGDHVPVILITGYGDVGLAVNAMRSGACDFLEKPVGGDELLASIARALGVARDICLVDADNTAAAARVAGLTERQVEVMTMVLAGHPNKNIAADLGISQRTVENHRAAVMHRMGVKSLPELARLVLRAESAGPRAVSDQNGSGQSL